MNIAFANALEMALIAGVADLREVVSWADREIEISDSPSIELIDLALSDRLPTALERLHKLPIKACEDSAVRIHFRFLFRAVRAGKVSHAKVASNLYWLAVDGMVDRNPTLSPMYVFDDYLELAERGIWGSPQEIKDEIMVFLLAEMADGPPNLFPDDIRA